MQNPSLKITSFLPKPNLGLSKFDLDYLLSPEKFNPLINHQDYIEQIRAAIELRKSFTTRPQLVEAIRDQYKNLPVSISLENNLKKLKNDNCFTVCCAHQPCIMGGPLYWLYKILNTISISQSLKTIFPEFDFVPVYYIGFEDHDFDEINHIYIFNKHVAWNHAAGTAVGKFDTEGLESFILELIPLFSQNSFAENYFHKHLDFIKNNQKFTDYYNWFVNDLFGQFGLVTIQPDTRYFKQQIIPLLEKEIQQSFISTSCAHASKILNELGYDSQVNPREINLFYHDPSGRKRIIKKSDTLFSLHDDSKSWTIETLLADINNTPEKFSPNVLFRPLLQESILPNVAFVGGGAELHYWMQLKSTFEFIGIPYPALIRRSSAFLLDQKLQAKIIKSQFDTLAFIHTEKQLQDEFIQRKQIENPVPNDLIPKISELLDHLNQHAAYLDQPTHTSISGEIHKILKSLDQIENKVAKYLKTKHTNELNQLLNIREQFYPSGKLQERTINFLPFYLKVHDSLFQEIINGMNPLNKDFYILEIT